MTHINEENVLRDYIAGMPVVDIARDNDCSLPSISRIAKKHGILRRNNFTSRGQNFKHNFFDVIDTEEKAYWLGFITADGCVHTKNNKNLVSIHLAGIDHDHIVKFRSAIGADTKKIYTEEYEHNGKIIYGSQLQFSSKQMVFALKSHGVNENKSGNVITAKIPHELENHYWRGLVDGNGTISCGKIKSDCHISLCGSFDIVREFKNYCDNITGRYNNVITKTSDLVYCYKNNGTYSVIVSNALYSCAEIYLDRKKNEYDEMMVYFQN